MKRGCEEISPHDCMEKENLSFNEGSAVVSRMPLLHAFVKEALKLSGDEWDQDTFGDSLRDLEAFSIQMRLVYGRESRFEEKTPEFLRESAVIEENFRRLEAEFAQLKTFFDSQEKTLVEEGTGAIVMIFEDLFAAFDRLKEKELKREVFSRSPFLNEVMRVADCVMRGTLPADALRDRLEVFIKIQEGFYRGFDSLQPSGDEQRVFEENRDAMKKALQEMLDGLYEARLYFQDSNEAHLEDGLEKSHKAADFLADMEEKLNACRDAPKVKLCFKCGAENPRTVKYCVKCSYNFPPLQSDEESTFDVRVEEAGVRQTGHVMTENLMKLSRAVEDVKTEKIDVKEFLETVEWYSQMLESTRAEAEKTKEPENLDTPEAREMFEAFRQTFMNGLADIGEGLALLRSFADTGNPDSLDGGIELVLTGGDQLFHVQMMSEQMKALAEQPA